MNKTTEALKLAEEALLYHTQQTRPIQKTDEALAAIREALADDSADTGNMVYSKPSVFDGVCCGCSKKAADGWALYCVECYEKSNGDPFANAGKPITEPVQEPVPYVDSTPYLHVGDSSFEGWYQTHPKACGGDKQLARDAYAAGMGDPLVAPVQPVNQELNWGANKFMPHEQPVKRPQNCGTGYCSCIECIYGKDGCVAGEGKCADGCLARESAGKEALKLADEIDAEFCQGRISNHNGRKAAQMLRALADAPVQPVKQEPVCKTCESLARTVMMDQAGKA